jgi:adenylate cyclase
MTKWGSSFLRRLPLAPLLCFGAAWLLAGTDFVRDFEARTLDWRTALRVAFQAQPDPRLAIVLYEDATNDAAPRLAWPPERDVHGEIIGALAFGQPEVVVFDVILDAGREGEGDAKLVESVRAARKRGVKVVTAAVTNPELGVPAAPGGEGPTRALRRVEGDINALVGDVDALRPFPQLRAVSFFGFADTPQGRDGIQREVPLVVRVGREVFPSLALQTLMAYFDVPAERVRVRLGDAVYLETKTREWRLPVSAGGRFLLNYRYDRDENGDDFPTYSALQVLVTADDFYVEKKKFAPKPPPLDGRIVLLGQMVTGKADAGATPRSGLSPLVLIHANLLNNVLADDFARKAPAWVIWLAALACGGVGVVVGRSRSLGATVAFAVLGLVSYGALALVAWIEWSLWLPVVGPILGFTALEFVVIGARVRQEQRARERVKQMFGSYLSPQLVNRMVASGEEPRLGGHREQLTAYFSDVVGFSTISEQLEPELLVELMNDYLTACTDILQTEGGTLDKYIGDAIVVMFGAPIVLPDHAYRACVAALRVQARLAALRERWRGEGARWPECVRELRTRIGLNTGTAVVGNMGSRMRFNYTMMGDNVNLAARMESGAKAWGVHTMCTEATKAECETHGGDHVVFRPLGRIVVKGRAGAVPFFEIVGLREEVTDDTRTCIAIFTQGLERYLARDWNGAEILFRRSAEYEPENPGRVPGITTNPSLIYLEIVARCIDEPPPEDWGGAHVMREK